MEEFSSYGIDGDTGFVPAAEPLRRLPPVFDTWEEIIPDMSALIRAEKLRPRLARPKPLDASALSDVRERERAITLS